MTESVFDQPTPEQLDDFVAGDPIAIDGVVRLLLPQLCRWAIAHYPNLPEDEIRSTVNLIFAETCLNHARYTPHKSKLTTYLIWLLKLRLADLYKDIKSESSDFAHHEKLLQTPYNDSSTIDTPTRLTREAFFQDMTLLLDAHEQDFLELMRKGEKSLQAFVAILVRHSRPTSNPDHEVKNTKERLIRKLRHIANEQGYSLQDLLGG